MQNIIRTCLAKKLVLNNLGLDIVVKNDRFEYVKESQFRRIIHNALHARFEEKERLRWKGIMNYERVLERVELDRRATPGLTNDRKEWRQFICTHHRQMAGVGNV